MEKISDVIEFAGSVDDLVWKSPVENFNSTSVLIVDETHQALVLVNGIQYGLYGPGRHVLETPNIPIAKRLINMPTAGNTSFPCKIFYVNMLPQMSMVWGVPGNIKLEDPVYQVFMDIGARGTVNFVVTDCIKFLEKLVGFRNRFDPDELTNLDNGKFRGIINKWVTSDISKIMISGGVSYFTISENLFEISEVVKEQLSTVFAEYGVGINDFIIEAVVAGSDNVQALAEAKRAHASRRIQGYTWKDERRMDILQTAAGNTATMGGMQGAVGGFMMGGAVGGSLSDMLRSVLNGEKGGDYSDSQNSGTLSGTGIYNKVDPVDFLKHGAGKPGQVNSQEDDQPVQPSGISFSTPQPVKNVQQSQTLHSASSEEISFVNLHPVNNEQPRQSFQPSGISFANPQPVNPVQVNQSEQLSFNDSVHQNRKEESVPDHVQGEGGQGLSVKECDNCHVMIPANFKFCPYCGKTAARKCPECGMELAANYAFCPGCGHKLK